MERDVFSNLRARLGGILAADRGNIVCKSALLNALAYSSGYAEGSALTALRVTSSIKMINRTSKTNAHYQADDVRISCKSKTDYDIIEFLILCVYSKEFEC